MLKKTPLTDEEGYGNFVGRTYLMIGLVFGAVMGSVIGWLSLISVAMGVLAFILVTRNDILRVRNTTDEKIRAGIAADPDAAELTDEQLSQMVKRQPGEWGAPRDETKTILKYVHSNKPQDFSACGCTMYSRPFGETS